METQKQKPKFNPETELRSDLWNTLSVHELWLQHTLLESRISLCQRMDKGGMTIQMQQSLKFLDAIIEEKSNKEKNVADAIVIR